MFEKELEECTSKFMSSHADGDEQNPHAEYFDDGLELGYRNGFKDGAEYGYNKASEWHYVKDGDLPTKKLEEKQLLIRVRNYTEDYIFAYYMLDKYYSKHGKRFYSDIDCDHPIDTEDVISWKEIIPPKKEK